MTHVTLFICEQTKEKKHCFCPALLIEVRTRIVLFYFFFTIHSFSPIGIKQYSNVIYNSQMRAHKTQCSLNRHIIF